MEKRLKYQDSKRLSEIREIRKRNKRKRRIWMGLFIMLILVSLLAVFDQKGLFDLVLKDKVSYDGNNTYVEVPKEEGIASRESIITMAQILINHPHETGLIENLFGLPSKPLSPGGYVDWVYYNVMGIPLSSLSEEDGQLTTKLWKASSPVVESELEPGDLGFYLMPEGNKVNHVGIYLGEIDDKKAFIHAGGIAYKAEGLEQGRVVISLNNTLKRNNKDINGNEFSPAAGPSQFMYYRRPQIEFK
ncbi:MAG: C40 family peptidase [Clostridium sp.]|nr:C40 family peptidase [Clostridium sp.]